MLDDISSRFRRMATGLDYYNLRLVRSETEKLAIRQQHALPFEQGFRYGAHLTVMLENGVGYAASSDLSDHGLKRLIRIASDWARHSARLQLIDYQHHSRQQPSGSYHSPVSKGWIHASLSDKLGLLKRINQKLKSHSAISDWHSALLWEENRVLQIFPDSEIDQHFCFLEPRMAVVACRGLESQKRTFGADYLAQSGLELLDQLRFEEKAEQLGQQAVQLLDADDCPQQRCDLLLMPNQMLLQIHESIGHPLELDRILGDERNYAGQSFVSLDMLGHYQYGSELLNVTFDPGYEGQIASTCHDDEGTEAQREYLIKNGVLLRPIGSETSQRRAGCAGVAASRACDWNRPAIDRMGNINLEPGNHPLADMIAQTENGILMDTNRSWSIDDLRNKFQFGCEMGFRIRDGELRELVKNPNYRGISRDFWHNLKAVGDVATMERMGTSICGKGEPQQSLRVGHASPACLFADVQIFGGGH